MALVELARLNRAGFEAGHRRCSTCRRESAVRNGYRSRVKLGGRRILAVGSAATLALGVALVPAGCSPKPDNSSGPRAATAPQCPTAPVTVAVSVSQWGQIVSTLGGNCATVTTVLASSSIDPHDYEPSPADATSFFHARLVVVNGAGYDSWAVKLAAASAPQALVVSAAAVTKTPDGANPHLWYSPPAVTAVADAVTAALTRLSPSAADYFGAQRSTFTAGLAPYTNLIAKLKSAAAGKSYAATESVFDYMAAALDLLDKTPEGYRRAATNETDPSPADIEAFRAALAGHRVDVLIYNAQTQGPVQEKIRATAQQSGVPIVSITETPPSGQVSFESWQVGQLDRLAEALGVPA